MLKKDLHFSKSNKYLYIRDARYWIFADIRYADIFKLILADADTDIFPFVWKQHQVSPVQKLWAKSFLILVSF